MFLLHTLSDVPITFGAIARKLLVILCSMAPRVDFVCDRYITPSIKNTERMNRGEDSITYHITGPEQKRPRNWQHALRSASFKTAFFKFLSVEWQYDQYHGVLKQHNILLAYEDKCVSFTASNSRVSVEELPELECSHEEADTKIALHMSHVLSQSSTANISIRCDDTDVLVILVHHVAKCNEKPNVWMEVGVGNRNNHRYINVSAISSTLGPEISDALPAFHAFTGCDYAAAFMGKGKQKPFDVMVKRPKFVGAFANLGLQQHIQDVTLQALEKYVCTLYGRPKMTSTNDARHHIFLVNYAPHGSSALEKMKGINPSSLPPCKSALTEKIRRTNFIAHVWKRATEAVPSDWNHTEYDWELDNSTFSMKWYAGNQIPNTLVKTLDDGESGQDSSSEDEVWSSSDDDDNDEDIV